MIRDSVQSSNLVSIGYDPATEILEIEFPRSKPTRKEPDRVLTARVQMFEGVPASVAAQLLEAPSKGSFFHAHIRDRYRNRPCAIITFTIVDGVETRTEERISEGACS